VDDPLRVCDAADVELVVIATPNATHGALARAALTAGKHVVVDKPFVLTGGEARELVALARERGLVLSVFQNRRFDGDFLAVKALLATGELGELLLFESRWDRFRASLASGWRYAGGPGSGLLWDLGSHLLDQAWQLFGAPDRWTADIGAQRARSGADDYFELTLWYGGLRCILSASLSVAAARPRFAAHGMHGSFTTTGLDPFEAALRAGGKPGEAAFRASLAPIKATRTEVSGATTPLALAAGHWEAFYPEIAAAISSGVQPSSAAEHVVGVISLIEAAKAAH
jgi:scyllo-inositol 2-dehydrogenase (NADP+)